MNTPNETPTPLTDAAAGFPSNDHEETAQRLYECSLKLERANAALRAEVERLRKNAKLLPLAEVSNKVLTAHRNALEKEVERLKACGDRNAKLLATINEQCAMLGDIKQRAERAEQDTARLDWLEAHPLPATVYASDGELVRENIKTWAIASPLSLREAIDAARATGVTSK
jgi:hypothetical protein